jgi:hypothetical protein
MTIAFFIFAAIGLAALAGAWRHVRGTTLVAAWWWSLFTLAAVSLAEMLEFAGAWESPTTAAAIRLASRALLVCPAMSLLGAKRPQHGAWNFVVVTLWGILALPAAEALLATGQRAQIAGFRSWLLAALLVVSLANALPTRHWHAALLAFAGQALLLAEHLPLPQFGEWHANQAWLAPLGMGLLAGATAIFAAWSGRSTAANSLDRLWLDFRDRFGLMWSLRVQERMNSAAQLADWPVTLTWSGFETRDGTRLTNEVPLEQQQAILVTMRALLRRFVSADWIDVRLGESAEKEGRPTSSEMDRKMD